MAKAAKTPAVAGPAVLEAVREGGLLGVTVCPQYLDGCQCGGGEHRQYWYVATPPEGDARSEADWAASCAQEAVGLVARATKALRAERVAVSALVGMRAEVPG